MAKLLIINPNTDSIGRHSIAITLISALLNQNHHQVELFDTTFMDTKYLYEKNNTHEELNLKLHFFKKADLSGYGLNKEKVDVIKQFESKLDSYNPDFIAFSFWGSNLHGEGEFHAYFHALRIIELANTKDIPIFVGGTVPSWNPVGVLKHPKINHVIMGEGEYVFLDIANRIDSRGSLAGMKNLWMDKGNGEIEKNELRPLIENLDDLPHADFDVYDDRTFFRPYHGNVRRCVDYELSRGCVYDCTFCLSPFQRKLYGSPKNFRREKSIPKIIDEISYLKNRYRLDMIRYQDETFLTMSAQRLKELSEAYRKHVNLPFTCEVVIPSISEEKLEYLKEMGCLSMSLGLESGSRYLRDTIIKKPKFDNEEVIEKIHMIKRAGISLNLFNMIGFPEETRERVFETIEVNYKAKPPYCQVGYFQPWEGTALRDTAIASGLLDKDSAGLDNSMDNLIGTPLTDLPVSAAELKHFHDTFTYYVYIHKIFRPLIRYVGGKGIKARFITFILTSFLRIRLALID